MSNKHIFRKPRDISGTTFTSSGPDIDAFTDGEFPQFTIDLNLALHTLGYARINIYTDASGTIFAQDSNATDISARLITQTTYTYPYTDVSGNIIVGIFTITFDDGSTFSNDNTNNTIYWYSILETTPAIIYQFT